jgi:RHS repeat-associated protein
MSKNQSIFSKVFAACALALIPSHCAVAQVPSQLDTGYPENGIFHGSEIDNVQFANFNLHVQIPISRSKGRGLNFESSVVWNSKIWTFHTQCFTSGGGFCQDEVQTDPLGFASPAFFGSFDYIFSTNSTTCSAGFNLFYTKNGAYTLREPDGTKHHFVPDYTTQTASCVPPPSSYPTTVYADDGSGWIMLTNASDGSVIQAINKNGTRIVAPSGGNGPAALIVDANGNQMQPSGCCNTGLGGTDTLGRIIPPNGAYYDSSGTLQSPTFGVNTNVAIQTSLCQFSSADQCLEKSTTWSLPTQLQLPSGGVFNFTYAQNAGGELASMTLPSGGQISWGWGAWKEGGRDIASRTVSANGITGQWTYSSINGGVIVTDPAGKDMRETAASGDKFEYFDGAVDASPLIKTVLTEYQGVTLNTVGGPAAYGLPIRETTTWNQQNLQMKTETDWDSMVISGVGSITWRNPIEKRVFDWAPVGTTMPLLQRTHSSYRHLESDGQAYLTFNIADLPTLVQVYDGGGNLNAQTQNSYDGNALTQTGTCQLPGVPNHDYCNYGTSNLTRGNLTLVSRWINTNNTSATTTNTYDDLGNLLSTSDPLGHPTTFDYTDNWGGTGCVTASSTLAFPTTVTNAKGQRTKTSYFPCTSLPQSKKDENDIAAGRNGTTMTYDLMNRPRIVQTLDANGQILAKTKWDYNDSVLPLSITKTVTATPSPDIVSTVILDDLGRTHQAIQSDPEGDVTSDTNYDSFGRVANVTNPHRSVAADTDGLTQYVYDTLGRTKDVIKPDNNTVHTDYAANAVTVTDETLRQRKSISDGLGRLIEVDEPGDPFSGIQAQGSIDIGAIKTTLVGGHPATTATGSVTINGAEKSKTTNPCLVQHRNCPITIYDSGTISVTANGHTDQAAYGQGDNVGTVANRLAANIRTNSSYVDYTSVSVNLGATPPTATINLVSRSAGSSTNYALSATYTYDTADFTAGSFTTAPSGAALTGGTDAFGGSPVTDHGTVTISAGTFTSASVPYGPGTSNTTSALVATALANALSVPGSGVTASTNGGTVITVLESAAGTAGNGVVVNTHPTSADPTDFPSPSFSVNPISLSGGADPYPSGLAHAYVTLYSYDALGNLLCVEQHGNLAGTGCSADPSNDATSPWRVRRFTYDSLSRLLSAKNPEAGQTTYQYDNDSNVISKTDARGVTINYSPAGSPIDVLHRVTQKTYSDDTPTVSYTYDVSCCGVTPENAIGRMTAAFTGSTQTELVFSYDPLGRIKKQWDCPPSGIARGFCYVISALYDATGKITSLTYPDNRVVTSAYTAAGRFLKTDLASFNGTPVNYNYYTVPQTTSPTSWGYWPSGAMNRGTYGNGVIEITGFNNRLQVSSIIDSLGSTTLFSKTYAYADGSGHNNGNILTIADTLSGTRNQTFTYDSLNRIVTGAQADNAFNLTYSYDPWGNMKESGTSNFQPLFDVNNRMTPSAPCTPNLVSYCYDAAGDLLMDNHNHVYAYDGEARIKSVDGTTATYTYNAAGNRVRKDAGTVSTEYFFFGGTVVAELNPATGAFTDYIGYGKKIAKDNSNNGTGTQYYHGDHLGSARIMTDATGTKIQDCTFNPFGEQVICSPDNASNHYRFSGKERDSEDGLDDFGARYYGSSMGRWATPDPANFGAHRGNPQSFNAYSYAYNDPLSLIDPDGLEPVKAQAGTISGFAQDMNNSPHTVGLTKGQNAWRTLQNFADTNWKFVPTQVAYFNFSKNRYVYTGNYGWVDMVHFLFYAGVSSFYKANNVDNPVEGAVRAGHLQERIDSVRDPWSAYSYEDLPSDRLGAIFGAQFFDPNSPLTLAEQMQAFFAYLAPMSPEMAPNWAEVPDVATRNDPTHRNYTTDPMFTQTYWFQQDQQRQQQDEYMNFRRQHLFD